MLLSNLLGESVNHLLIVFDVVFFFWGGGDATEAFFLERFWTRLGIRTNQRLRFSLAMGFISIARKLDHWMCFSNLSWSQIYMIMGNLSNLIYSCFSNSVHQMDFATYASLPQISDEVQHHVRTAGIKLDLCLHRERGKRSLQKR